MKRSHQSLLKGSDLAKTSSKLATEHEKLRQDLAKEIESSKTLKIKLAVFENTLSEKEVLIAQLEQKLQEAESRAPNLEGLDSKQWKTAVVTRMFEQKLKSIEGELEEKVGLSDEMVTCLIFVLFPRHFLHVILDEYVEPYQGTS